MRFSSAASLIGLGFPTRFRCRDATGRCLTAVG